MTHVVCEPCFGCKYTDCVVVCPVECFYEGEKILYNGLQATDNEHFCYSFASGSFFSVITGH